MFIDCGLQQGAFTHNTSERYIRPIVMDGKEIVAAPSANWFALIVRPRHEARVGMADPVAGRMEQADVAVGDPLGAGCAQRPLLTGRGGGIGHDYKGSNLPAIEKDGPGCSLHAPRPTHR